MTEGTENTGASAPVHAIVHTPGPWMVFNEKYPRVGPSHNCTVAGVFIPPTGDQKANAQLIAAAPELYQALKSALQIVALWGPCDDVSPEHEGEMQALTAMQVTFEDLVARVENVV